MGTLRVQRPQLSPPMDGEVAAGLRADVLALLLARESLLIELLAKILPAPLHALYRELRLVALRQSPDGALRPQLVALLRELAPLLTLLGVVGEVLA
eukprot:scaffold50475_cov66-Phaeocystis_antarctica.AAC.13